jgi:hypothetical protein
MPTAIASGPQHVDAMPTNAAPERKAKPNDLGGVGRVRHRCARKTLAAPDAMQQAPTTAYAYGEIALNRASAFPAVHART